MSEPVLTAANRVALAAMCRDVGAALVRFGRSLDASVAPAPVRDRLAAGARVVPDAEAAPSDVPSRKLGRVQQSVLDLPGLRDSIGLSTGEVASALGIAPPNAHQTLTTLAGRGVVERVGEDKPARWRLVVRSTTTAKPLRRAAASRKSGTRLPRAPRAIGVRP